MHSSQRQRNGKPSATKGRLFGPRWLGLTVIALFAGMLFWSKLRVSSVVPRSAYATPEEGSTVESENTAERDEAESEHERID